MANLALKPEIIYENGKPTSVIISFSQYNEIIEELEDLRDIQKRNLDPEFISFEELKKEDLV